MKVCLYVIYIYSLYNIGYIYFIEVTLLMFINEVEFKSRVLYGCIYFEDGIMIRFRLRLLKIDWKMNLLD